MRDAARFPLGIKIIPALAVAIGEVFFVILYLTGQASRDRPDGTRVQRFQQHIRYLQTSFFSEGKIGRDGGYRAPRCER